MRQPAAPARRTRNAPVHARVHGHASRRTAGGPRGGSWHGRVQPDPRARDAALAPVPDPVTLAAATWLACGIVLLLLTPLPLHTAALGWSPAFWGLLAPAAVLLARVTGVRSARPDASGPLR